MKKTLVSLLVCFSCCLVTAVEAPQFLQRFSGCFNVTYRFMEEGRPVVEQLTLNDGQLIREWISLEAVEKGWKLQHFGISKGSDQNDKVMRHFGELWLENESQNGWVQKVLSPSGSPRYTCSGQWVGSDFHCVGPNAPKPLRDRNRTDYDVLDRQNIIVIRSNSWIQMESNRKKKSDGVEVSREVGLVKYQRIDSSQCEAAQHH